MNDIWVPVLGYEGYYEVSNTGKVRSLPRLLRRADGHFSKHKGRELNPSVGRTGYLFVNLSANGVAVTKYVHVIVWVAFYGAVPYWLEINHEDGIKANCHIDNLDLTTPKGNTRHAMQHGLKRHAPNGKWMAKSA